MSTVVLLDFRWSKLVLFCGLRKTRLVVVALILEYFVKHEITETCLIPWGIHGWDVILVFLENLSLEEILHLLLRIEFLQVIYDCHMINELATFTLVLVWGFQTLNFSLFVCQFETWLTPPSLYLTLELRVPLIDKIKVIISRSNYCGFALMIVFLFVVLIY